MDLRRGQSAIEYLFLVALIVVILVPLFYYGTAESTDVKKQKAEDAVKTVTKLADDVHYLGPGNRIETVINVPRGTVESEVREKIVKLVVSGDAAYSDITEYAIANLTGYIPSVPGTYTMVAEASDVGVCVYPKGHREDNCYCFDVTLQSPVIDPIEPNNRMIECRINNSVEFKECTNNTFSYGSTLTEIRAKCSDTDGDLHSVSFKITADGETVYGPAPYTKKDAVDQDIYVVESNYLFEQSGNINITVECRDECFGFHVHEEGTGFINTTFPYGVLIPYLINPTNLQEINYSNAGQSNWQLPIHNEEWINFRAGIKCVGGECVGINLSIDPS